MTLPLYTQEALGYEAALVLYSLVGVGFGFALERAGFGYAPNLAAQFYGTDTRVLKVMFTAIVTACVGIVLLSAAGVVNLAAVQVPHTYLWPQLAGGLLLGVGFIVSGYCPGTSVVAMTSGKWDGLATIAGVGLGSLAYGFLSPALAPFANSGDLGVYRLTDLLGLPDAVLALAVLAMAAGAFLLAERAERFFSRRRGIEPPVPGPRSRNGVLASLGVAAVLALGLAVGAPRSSGATGPLAPSPAPRPMSPESLAVILIERPWSVWLLDLREPSACEKARIPGALCRPADLDATVRGLPPTRTLVLYGEGELAQVPDAVKTFSGPVAVLAGGYAAFASRFSGPPDDALARTDPRAYRLRSAVHSWLTGAATSPPPPPPPSAPQQRAPRKGGGC